MHSLVQNSKIKTTLTGWIHSGRFPHAILLEGPKGSGRKTVAKIIARALLCTGEKVPCGECSHCKKIEKDIHPDMISVQGKGGPRSFSIDAVREIRTQAFVRPNEADRKVFLLLNTEEMTVEAQNALLKIIEEPPEGVYFILVCENRGQMLPTIQSRVATLTLQLPDVETAQQELKMRISGKSDEEYHRAALQAGGNIGQALKLLEDDSADERYQKARDVFIALLENRELDALSGMEDCARDRPLFLERLSFLRSFAMALLVEETKSVRYSSLQISRIVDIIDKITVSAEGNVSLLLLTTLLCADIRQVLSC